MAYILDLRKQVGKIPLIMVGAAVLVLDDRDRLLLQRRRDNGCWAIMGGSIELGETFEEAARREAREESGLVLGELTLVDEMSGPELFHEYPNGDQVYNTGAVYLCRQFTGQLAENTDEGSELRFFHLDALPEQLSPPDRVVIGRFLQKFCFRTNKLPLILRALNENDCEVISAAFQRQGWHKPVEQYRSYYVQQQAGQRDVILAELHGEFAGYLTIVWQSGYPPFREAGIPEIVDLNILIRFRRLGISSRLMDEAEWRISARSPFAGLGVGLTADYGAAQQLYVRRGYLPDGRGLFYDQRPCAYRDLVTVDDSLTLQLTRRLR